MREAVAKRWEDGTSRVSVNMCGYVSVCEGGI